MENNQVIFNGQQRLQVAASGPDGHRWQRTAIPLGRMSLTNYITQSIIGVTLFYGFGLGLYRYCGASLSLLIALAVICVLTMASRKWLTNHRQGPLERLWKQLTWINATSTKTAVR